MKNVILIILGLAVVLGVVLYAVKNNGGSTGSLSNAEILGRENNTPINTIENLEYFGEAQGFFARPAAEGIYPGIVMIHENRGLRPEIKMMAEELAKEGYMVLAVDLLGKPVETQDEARALTAGFNREVGIENMQAAADYLRGQGATKIASLGWCFGGRQSVELAISGEKLDATVVYYGGGMATSTEKLAPVKWPVLGIFGDADQAIPVQMVKDFEKSLNTLGVTNEIYIYPGVGHAFANPSGMNYAPEETKDAWAKTVTFLNKHLKNVSTTPNSQIITTRINEGVSALGLQITPKEVVEDSRCPVDVQCIQAGTVQVRATVASTVAHGEPTFKLGEAVRVGDYSVTFFQVDPAPRAGQAIDNYVFYFRVGKP